MSAVVRQVPQTVRFSLTGNFDNCVLEHLQLRVVVLSLVVVVVLLVMGYVWLRELVLVEEIVGVLLRPGNYRVFEDVRIKLEQPGCVELGLKLLGEVVKLHHVVAAVVRALVKLVYIDDDHHALRLLHHLLQHLVSDLLDEAVFLPNKTFFIPQEMAILAIQAIQFLFEVAKIDRKRVARSTAHVLVRRPRLLHRFHQIDAGHHVVTALSVFRSLESLLVEFLGFREVIEDVVVEKRVHEKW